jgi:ferredoxin
MPKITLVREQRVVEAENGATLRDVLLANGVNPYRGANRLLNCRGHGHCKTCRVKLQPESNASPRTPAELPRASRTIFQMADHRELLGWRLSCQVKIRGDVAVTTQA